ncbi:MAG: UDP-glucose 4-epimerase GalE [Thermomicrobiales bacterium]|nr:UDP-glucose 4-epimerase GalE [Thermomicrobiales bacterium]
MKIVVTGGAGYIGSAATHRLAAGGHDVLVIDNLHQGHVAAVPGGARFARVDITDALALREVVCEFRPEAVMHFAALTIAPESVIDPAPYWRVNLAGTLNLLDAMRAAGTSKLVFSSTAAVYGVPEHLPVKEDAAKNPINPYGAAKLAAEEAIATYAQAYDFSTAVLRYFNVAGASDAIGEDHAPETHLIPNVLFAAAGRAPALTVFGTDFPTRDGTAIRDYVHVLDLADAHTLALEALQREEGTLGAFNLGTRDGATVREVVETVERVTGENVPIQFADRRPGDPPVLVADSTRARTVLGWEPERSTLDEMVASAWRWFQANPGGYPG